MTVPLTSKSCDGLVAIPSRLGGLTKLISVPEAPKDPTVGYVGRVD